MKLSFQKPSFLQQTPQDHKEDLSFLKQHVISDHDTSIRLWKDLKEVFSSHELLLQELSFLQQETSSSPTTYEKRFEGVKRAATEALQSLQSLSAQTQQKPGLHMKQEKLESTEQTTRQLDNMIQQLQQLSPENRNHVTNTTTTQVNEYLNAFKKGMLEFTG